MNQDWDIKPRGEGCYKCNAPFADKQAYFSALTHEADGYKRADYCLNCRPDSTASTTVSSWNGVFKMPPPPPEDPLKKETAEGLLRSLLEKNDPARINAIYILAVMLERKRILIERDVQLGEDGSTTRIYEHKQTGESIMIREPHLQLDQLQHVQEEVIALLGSKTPANPTPATAEAAAPETQNKQ